MICLGKHLHKILEEMNIDLNELIRLGLIHRNDEKVIEQGVLNDESNTVSAIGSLLVGIYSLLIAVIKAGKFTVLSLLST